MKRSAILSMALLLAATTGPLASAADDPPAAKAAAQSKSARKARPPKRAKSILTPSREAAALAFVKENHSELLQVLKQLKAMQPDQYEEAIAELFQTSEQLAELSGRDETRYQLALESWKLQSRIELLAARMTRRSSDGQKRELQELLSRQVDLKIKQHRLEQERLESRLRRNQEQLERLQSDREKFIASHMRRLLPAKAQDVAPAKEPASKPAPKKR